MSESLNESPIICLKLLLESFADSQCLAAENVQAVTLQTGLFSLSHSWFTHEVKASSLASRVESFETRFEEHEIFEGTTCYASLRICRTLRFSSAVIGARDEYESISVEARHPRLSALLRAFAFGRGFERVFRLPDHKRCDTSTTSVV